MTHQKIRFKGTEYWLNGDCISPLSHFSDEGELLCDPFEDISYAIVEGQNIKRYRQVIGTLEEVEFLTPALEIVE